MKNFNFKDQNEEIIFWLTNTVKKYNFFFEFAKKGLVKSF